MKEVYVLMALAAGVVVTVQSGINAQLNQMVKASPLLSALISFLVGTLALVLLLALSQPRAFSAIPLPQAHTWWKFTGGLLGAFYVSAIIIIFPKLGAATSLSLVIAGQLVFAVILDHFGWLGFEVKPVNLYRLAGIALIIGGVLLVRKF